MTEIKAPAEPKPRVDVARIKEMISKLDPETRDRALSFFSTPELPEPEADVNEQADSVARAAFEAPLPVENSRVMQVFTQNKEYGIEPEALRHRSPIIRNEQPTPASELQAPHTPPPGAIPLQRLTPLPQDLPADKNPVTPETSVPKPPTQFEIRGQRRMEQIMREATPETRTAQYEKYGVREILYRPEQLKNDDIVMNKYGSVYRIKIGKSGQIYLEDIDNTKTPVKALSEMTNLEKIKGDWRLLKL